MYRFCNHHPFAGREWITVDELKDQTFVGHSREIAPPSFDAFIHLCMQYALWVCP